MQSRKNSNSNNRRRKTYPFQYLVFEGGGIKGAAYAKVPRALAEYGILDKVTKVAGSSAGAIISVLICLKYAPDKIETMIRELEFIDFKDYVPLISLRVFNILFKSGEYSGHRFEKWLRHRIQYKTGSKDTTLQELYNWSGIELVLTGTCLTTRTIEYFSHKTFPEMPVWVACRISMSIPGFFMPFTWNDQVYVDGGILYNYPIWIFDNPTNYSFNVTAIDFLSERTLGFKLISQPGCDTISRLPNILPVLTTFYTILGILLEHVDVSYVHQSYWERTVGLDTEDVHTTEFNITPEKKDKLIENGYNNTKIYLDNYALCISGAKSIGYS